MTTGTNTGKPKQNPTQNQPQNPTQTTARQITRISVIVPVYNTSRYLKKCLDSLLAQTLEPERMEIIVVDDGSTDDSGAIADEYAAKDRRIRVLHQKNAGSSAARNAGIAAATGDAFGFVDSDDFVDPGMYAAMVSAMETTGAGIVQTGRDEIAEDGSRLPGVVTIPEKDGFIMSEEMMFLLLLHEGDASFCTKLTAREVFGDLTFPVGELNEDFKLLMLMLERIDRLAVLSRCDYHVFYRTGSNSRRNRDDEDYFPPVFTDIVKNSDFAMEIVKTRHPGILPAAKRFALVQRLDYLLHIPVKQMRKDNKFYRNVAAYVRKNRLEIFLNPYLSKKERRNLYMLSFAPRTARAVHSKLMKLKRS